jgi:hypothetical protein
MTRLLGAIGFILSLTLLTSPAQAVKGAFWYTRHSCQFYPGGGHRTPAEVAACRKQKAVAGEVLRFCRDQQRKGPLPCAPNQSAVWTVVR